MLKNGRLLGIKVIIMIMFASSLCAGELEWLHDYDKAMAQAKKEQKDVYLFIGADKCKFCARFKAITLANTDVIKRLKKDYVLLYLSRDQHTIPLGFKTTGVPRHYFLTTRGQIIHDTWGGREVAGFYDVLDEAELNRDDFK